MAASLAPTFFALFLARLAAGLCSGPILPLTQSYAANLGSASRRGLRMGVVQGLGSSLLGAVLAPLILVPAALHWHWRGALLLIGAGAILSAALLARALHSSATTGEHRDTTRTGGISHSPDQRSSVSRNIVLCCLISAAMIAWLILTLTFYPSYLVGPRQRSAAEMGTLMSLMGMGSLIAAFLVPYLSDGFGRRKVMIAFSLVGALSPAMLLFPYDSPWLLGAGMFAGSFAGGTIPLFMAVIPSESVAAEKLPRTIGMVQGVGEIVGGVLTPTLAGWAADRLYVAAPLSISLFAALFAAACSLALKEDAQRLSREQRAGGR
jgi:MFS family permease